MKHKYLIAAVATLALAFVGAGCVGKPTVQKVTPTKLPAPTAPPAADDTDTPDGAVNAIMKEADIGGGTFAEEEKDATAETKAATPEITDFADTKYDAAQ